MLKSPPAPGTVSAAGGGGRCCYYSFLSFPNVSDHMQYTFHTDMRTITVAEWATNQNKQTETSAHLQRVLKGLRSLQEQLSQALSFMATFEYLVQC